MSQIRATLIKAFLILAAVFLLGGGLLYALLGIIGHPFTPAEKAARQTLQAQTQAKEALDSFALSENADVLAAVFDFEWDSAYQYLSGYGNAGELEEKYQISIDGTSLSDSAVSRVFFFKGDTPVLTLYYPAYSSPFPDELERFSPSTVFERRVREGGSIELSPKDPTAVTWRDPQAGDDFRRRSAQTKKALDAYARAHKTFTLESVLGFEWDRASQRLFSENFGENGGLSPLRTYKISFYSHDKLVRSLTYPQSTPFDETLGTFYPDTVFESRIVPTESGSLSAPLLSDTKTATDKLSILPTGGGTPAENAVPPPPPADARPLRAALMLGCGAIAAALLIGVIWFVARLPLTPKARAARIPKASGAAGENLGHLDDGGF